MEALGRSDQSPVAESPSKQDEGSQPATSAGELDILDPAVRKRTPLLAQLGRYRGGLFFLSGLLLGWLLIGWWLWPVQWTDSNPWDLRSTYQKRYITLVAAENWRTGNADQAREDLAGWDAGSLAALLAAMPEENPNPELREQLAVLRKVLNMPDPRPLPKASPRQKALLWSAALAALLQIAALALAFGSRLTFRLHATSEARPPELSERLAEGELATWLEALEEPEGQGTGLPTPGQAGKPTGQETSQQTADGQGATQQMAGDQEPDRQETGKPKPGEQNKDGKSGSGSAKAVPEQGSAQAVLQAVDLANQDESEATLTELFAVADQRDPEREALLKIVENVPIGVLVQQSRQVLEQLEQAHRSREMEGIRR